MVRKKVALDERLLEEALRLSGERTYSGVVRRALDDYVRRARARGPPVFLVDTRGWIEFFHRPSRNVG